MQDSFGNYVLNMRSIGDYFPDDGGGGGGEGDKEVFSGAGNPNVTPDADDAVWLNTSTGEIHQWYGGNWH